MSATFTLRLDTTAPVVTFGAVDGTVAGELLRVAYTIDEPSVGSAELRLSDGRVIPMTVLPGEVQVVLPGDTPTGDAIVRVFTSDDVDNTGTQDYTVALVAAITATAPGLPRPGAGITPTAPTPAPRPRERERRTITSISTWAPTSSTRVRARDVSTNTSTVASTSATRRRSVERSLVVTASTDHARAVMRGSPQNLIEVTGTVGKRPEGPMAEDELLGLDLL